MTHVLHGIFTRLRFPFAHFPVTNVKGEVLFTIIWEAIERLENIGLKVTVIVGDGASVNRKFVRMHAPVSGSSPYNPVHKIMNPYSDEGRHINFMSDVPHLLKTTRNNWSHSFSHGNTRNLWVL